MSADLLDGFLTPRTSQLALFFAPDTVFRAVRVANAISEAFSDLFSTEPTVLPADAPAEIPRVFFQEGGVGQLTVSYHRADLILDLKASADPVGKVVSTGKTLALKLVDELGLKSQRLGLVLAFDLDATVSLDMVKRRYVLPGKMADAQELDIGWLRRVDVHGHQINRWVRFSVPGMPGNNGGVIIDSNTLAEVRVDCNAEFVGAMVQAWMDEIWGDIDGIVGW